MSKISAIAPPADRRVVDWRAEFESAIALHPIDQTALRQPQWFIIRFTTGYEALLSRLIGLLRLPYHDFTYRHRRPLQAPTIRRWLPGHMFVEFDPDRDYWQQILRMPANPKLLGRPTPLPDDGPGSMQDLRGRLPYVLGKRAPRAQVSPGQRVRVTKGPLSGTEGAVTACDAKSVRLVSMMFGRPTEIAVALANLEVLG